MAKNKIKNSPKEKKKTANYFIILVGSFLAALVLFFVVKNLLMKEETTDEYSFTKEGELIFTDSLDQQKAKINIEFADDEFKRQLGLMKRTKMKEDEGMLFIFPEEQMHSFWMLNTKIPLDIIFVNSEKQIINIHKNTTPLSIQSYPSLRPAKYVVEVVGGFTSKNNIEAGDKIKWQKNIKD
ncbi:MAG: DUF192 domain-containing protein [Ignavibacteriaceae bacterium]